MIYKNLDFFIFMIVLLGFYLSVNTHRSRLFLLIFSSLLFYLWSGVFDFFIFFFVVIISYLSVFFASKYQAKKKLFIFIGIFILTFHLFLWKYYNSLYEFIDGIYPLFITKYRFDPPLPLGISFFTFQGIAYLVDFYKNQTIFLNFKEFLLYKSFFPQLLAGPIVRPHQLVQQIKKLPAPTALDFQEGVMLFTIGLFKKIIIADRLYQYVDNIMNSPEIFSRTALLSASIGVIILIWADFGGFTDMGRGCARMLGIHLPKNFLSPLFSKSPSEFWLRWHVSFGNWVRAYVFTPIAEKRSLFFNRLTAILAAFLFSGLWHGAKLTFVFSFLASAVLVFVELGLGYLKISHLFKSILPKCIFLMITNFLTFTALSIFSASFFRARSFESAMRYFSALFINPGNLNANIDIFAWSFFYMIILEIVLYYSLVTSGHPVLEYLKSKYAQIEERSQLKAALIDAALGFLIGVCLIACIALRREGGFAGFIYFQF